MTTPQNNIQLLRLKASERKRASPQENMPVKRGFQKLPQSEAELVLQRTPELNQIVAYIWKLRKDGCTEETQLSNLERLTLVARMTNINDPEKVKETLSTLKWKNSTKSYFAGIYNLYLNFIGKTWTKPRYQEEEGLPFIPLEKEIDALIAAAGRTMSVFLQILKETGARSGEMQKLQWQHIDLTRRIIYITAEKGSNSRYLPMTTQLVDMINHLSRDTERVFPLSKHSYRVTFEDLRQRTAEKLNNPRLKAIHMHTFRHWKGTMEYHKTHSILDVKVILGHKNIESTMVYINLENALYNPDTDEYYSQVVHDEKELNKAITENWTLVVALNNTFPMYFKKRK